MSYPTGSYTIFHHRYYIVWGQKYRTQVWVGDIRERVRDIVHQVCVEMGVEIISGVLLRDHVHMLVGYIPSMGRGGKRFCAACKGRWPLKKASLS